VAKTAAEVAEVAEVVVARGPSRKTTGLDHRK
jgi:hypothetical protein